MEVEVIDFTRPDRPDQNVYICGIPLQTDEEELYNVLWDRFSAFGVLYEVKILGGDGTKSSENSPPTENQKYSNNLQAIVKFYSARAAAQARVKLTGRLCVHGQPLKLRRSTRLAPAVPVSLYFSKCFELANHFLGFNGWSLEILMLKENKEHPKIKPGEVQYVAGVKLYLRHDAGLTCEGYGVATMAYTDTDPTSRGVAVCRSQKQAYQQAVQNAFQKVLILILPSGKVYPEVNCTIEDKVFCDDQLQLDQVITVNDLDGDPEATTADDMDDSLDIDLLNQQLLEQLEDEG